MPTTNIYNKPEILIVALLGLLAIMLSAYAPYFPRALPAAVVTGLQGFLVALSGYLTTRQRVPADNLDPSKPATMRIVPSVRPPAPPDEPKP